MAGDKKITIQAAMEAKGFDAPVKEIKKIADEVAKLNKVISNAGKPASGQQPGLLGRLFGGSKAGETFGKQINADAKELRNFQTVLEKTGKVLDNSLTKNYANVRKELQALLSEQQRLTEQRSKLEKSFLESRDVRRGARDDEYLRGLSKEAMQSASAEIRTLDAQIAAGGKKIAEKQTEVEQSRPRQTEEEVEDGPTGVNQAKIRKFAGGLNAVNTALSVGSSFNNAIVTGAMAPMEYQARSSKFAGQLYSEMTGGNFASMAALLKNDQGQLADLDTQDSVISRTNALGNVAANSATLDAAGNVFGGASSAVANTGAVVVSGGMLGNPSGGLNQASQGFAALGNSSAARDAARAEAMLKTMQTARETDPVFEIMAQNAYGKAKAYTSHSFKTGGFDKFRELVNAGAQERMNDQEVMGLQSSLRDMAGETRGNQLFKSAAQSERKYGMDRGVAAQALSTISLTNGGDANRANESLERVITSAFSKGLKDSRIHELIAQAISQSGETVGGKFDATAMGDVLAQLMDKNKDQMAEFKAAVGGVSMYNQMFGRGTAQEGMEQSKQVVGMGAAKDIVKFLEKEKLIEPGTVVSGGLVSELAKQNAEERRAGGSQELRERLGLDLSKMNPEQRKEYQNLLDKVPQKALDILAPQISDPENRRILEEYGGKDGIQKAINDKAEGKQLPGKVERALANFTGDVAKVNPGGGSYVDAQKMLQEVSGSSGAPSATGAKMEPRQGGPLEKVAENQSKAAADLVNRLADPQTVAILTRASEASGAFIQQLSRMNKETLGDPEEVLRAAARGIVEVTRAAEGLAEATGQQISYRPTQSKAQPPVGRPSPKLKEFK